MEFGPPTTHVYNPLNYARDPSEQYLDLAGQSQKQVLFLGMNPGPWGMAQTGVPFGTVELVRDWLKIEGPVGKPASEHPKRPIEGFQIKSEEVSGSWFWGWVRGRFGTADRFSCTFSSQITAHWCSWNNRAEIARPTSCPRWKKVNSFYTVIMRFDGSCTFLNQNCLLESENLLKIGPRQHSRTGMSNLAPDLAVYCTQVRLHRWPIAVGPNRLNSSSNSWGLNFRPL